MPAVDADTRRRLLERLAGEVDPAFFETWCQNLDFVRVDDDLFEIPCPSRYCLDLVEPRLRQPLERAFEELTGRPPRVVFKVDPRGDVRDTARFERESRARATASTPAVRREAGFEGVGLREEFTFDTLIEGQSNRFAIAAGIQTARQPFEQPLFVHGKSGVGKTHLLHAVCHLARESNPDLRVAYMPCEAFISDFLNAIKSNRTEEFRSRYKSIDFLVIDDIDLLAHKEATQAEFFHLFNHLILNRRQMILSSDSAPRAIQTLQERVFSRLESGLVVRVDPPEFELRIAIVQAKAERKGKHLPEEVCRFIAEHIPDNIRELEGAVNKVIWLSLLVGKPVDPELAKEALKDRLDRSNRVVTVEDVISIVAGHFRVPPQELRRRTRKDKVVRAKQMCLYLCHTVLKHSTRELAGFLNLASHNSVAVAVRRMKEQIERNPSVRATVARLRDEIERDRYTG